MSFPAWIPVLGPLLARSRMKRDLPALMDRLGLAFAESDQRHWWGRFAGTLEGYAVRVDPDGRSLSVAFQREIEDIHFSTLDTGRKSRDHGLGHPRFEKVFRLIDVEPPVAERLRNRPEVLDRLLALWTGRVAGITVGQGGLSCVLHYPFDAAKGPHYVETADVERLLPELIAVVRLLEEVLGRR